MIHSPWSGFSLEQVHESARGRLWAQIAFWRDRKVTDEHIARAKNLGIDTLVIAADVTFSSKRERDIVHGTGMPPRPPIKDVFNSATWQDVKDLRAKWPGKIVVKGVASVHDAIAAREAGADGVFVSNHGGRQFDRQAATLTVLPQIAEVVAERLTVMVDGGVRRGSDVLAALNSGADLVSAGRPFAYGLAALGGAGVAQIYDVLKDELVTAMGFTGTRSL